MKKCLWSLIAVIPLMIGQGCPGVAPETRTQKAYRVCANAGLGSSQTDALFSYARADYIAGFSYSSEIYSTQIGCNNGCSTSYNPNCIQVCYPCGTAVVDAVYLGD